MKLDQTEIQNLKRLLSSPDSDNIILGIELLLQNPEALPDVSIPIFIFLTYGELEDYTRTKSLKKKLGTLWTNTISEAQRQQYAKETSIFDILWNYKDVSKKALTEAINCYEERLADYDELMSSPRYASLYYRLAQRIRSELPKMNEKAYYYYLKAVEGQPNKMEYKLNFADYLLNDCFTQKKRLEDLGRVEAILEEATAYYPSYKGSYYHILGILKGNYRKDYEAAKDYYHKALALNANAAGTLNNLANIIFKIDAKPEEALELTKKAVEIAPNNVHYLDTLAWIYFKGMGDAEAAEKLFWLCRKNDTKEGHCDSMMGLGEVLALRGEYTQAEEWYKKALKMEPDVLYKLLRMTELQIALGNKKEAKKYGTKALEIAPDSEEALQLMSKIAP